MKKLLYLLILLTFACSKEKANIKEALTLEDIIGKWELDSIYNEIYRKFTERLHCDGEYNTIVISNENLLWKSWQSKFCESKTETFTYSKNENGNIILVPSEHPLSRSNELIIKSESEISIKYRYSPSDEIGTYKLTYSFLKSN